MFGVIHEDVSPIATFAEATTYNLSKSLYKTARNNKEYLDG
jgi:hypothetical protein